MLPLEPECTYSKSEQYTHSNLTGILSTMLITEVDPPASGTTGASNFGPGLDQIPVPEPPSETSS
jgi:hypothetical protein